VASEPASAGEPIYKKWWFWTGVGVVVAGTVLAIWAAYPSSSNPCSGTGLGNCLEVK
jgi:hypothetical protein